MLLFIDLPKSIKVVREAGSHGSRLTLGTIHKGRMEPTPELLAALKDGEDQDIKSIIEVYATGEASQKKSDLFRFPQIIRAVIEYLQSPEISAAERQILEGAIREGAHQVRRLNRKALTRD